MSERVFSICEECPLAVPDGPETPACLPDEAYLRRQPDAAALVAPCLLRRTLLLQQELDDTNEELAQKNQLIEALEEQLRRDGLTGLYNYDGFLAVLANEFGPAQSEKRRKSDHAESRQFPRSGAVIFGDAEDFKALNDATNHNTADEGLKEVANIIAEMLRVSDLVCRRSGDEFIAFLPGAPADAQIIFDRIQDRLQNGVKMMHKGAWHTMRLRMQMVYRNNINGYEDVVAMINEADEAVNALRDEQTGRSRNHGPRD